MRLRWICLLCCVFLAGCESLGYAWQATRGQWEILTSRQSVDSVIADPATPPSLRANLQSVLQMRDYARHSLGFDPVTGFDSWVALDAEYPVWNVVAAPTFSVQPLQWCFPIAGCVSYRGYFNRADAEQYAVRLAQQGNDTWVYGVAAYSTLGWFDDPILSSWIDRSPESLAALVFHELAHQQLYVPGDTALSESYARVVEREAVRRWLLSQDLGAAYARYTQRLDDDRVFDARVLTLRDRLQELYNADLTSDEMREQKHSALDQFTREFDQITQDKPGFERFRTWVEGGLNNARLSGVSSYAEHVDALQVMLDGVNGDLTRFTAAVSRLSELTQEQRLAALNEVRDLKVEP